MDAVAVKTPGGPQPGTKGAPLMPSADASKSTLDATFSYAPKPRADVYKKPKKSLSPAQERKLVDNLIEKSVKAGKEHAAAHSPPETFVEPPKEDKNTAALALITAKHSAAEKEAPPHKDLAEVESSVKEHAEVKHARRHRKKHRRHRHHKPTGHVGAEFRNDKELVQTEQKSATQLDNLFLTVRDDLLTKSAKPHQTTLLQLDGKSKLRQREPCGASDTQDLSLDEEADLMLKGKARQITEEGKSGLPRAETTESTTHTEEKSKATPAAETPKDSALVNEKTKDAGEDILKSLLDDEESDQVVKENPNDCEEKMHASEQVAGMPDDLTLKLVEEATDDAAKAAAKKQLMENSKKKATDPNEGVDEAFKGPSGDAITLKLLGEHAEEKELAKAEKKFAPSDDLVMTQPCPESESPLGAGPQDDTFLQLGAEVQAQTQATMQARARATAQVEAASKAMSKLGIQQKSQVAA